MEATETKRTDLFKINPKNIIINWNDNPRNDYGTKEDFQDFKNSIKSEGIKSPIYLTKVGEDYVLTHGFRRMRATLELISEGVDIKEVPFLKVKNNKEQILFDHMTLNSGKALTDLEKSETLLQLKKYGYEPTELAKKTGIAYQKVINLLKFCEEATKEVKEAVRTGRASMTAGIEVVRQSRGDFEKQIEIIKSTNNIVGKVKVKNVSNKQIKTEETYKLIIKLRDKIAENKTKEGIDGLKMINLIIAYIEGNVKEMIK